MTCPHCGLPVGAGDERCRSCGWLLARPADATVPAARPSAAPAEGALPGAGATPAPGNMSAPTPPAAPGYPAYPQGGYPQGGQPPYAPYPYPAYPAYPPNPAYPGYPAGQQGGPAAPYAPYPYYYYPPAPPRRQQPVYPLVVSWIVTVVGGLSIISGLLVLALVALVTIGQAPDSLSNVGAATVYILPPIVGGIITVVAGIFGILRRPSPIFSMPAAWLLLALSVLAYGAAMVLWNLSAAPGPVLAVFPLVTACVALPSLTILAFTAGRLGSPSTRRHVWLSFIYGTTLAALVAGLANTIFAIIVVIIMRLLGFQVDFSAVDLSGNPQSTVALVALLLVVSVVAPVVEETTKPLGALLIIRRLRTPGEAFLVGMASGIGFAIVETLGDYVGQGQADWISVALERSTSGLLHGVGAGMGALGWYYLVNGKGVPLRWLRGLGCFAYAILQHGIYNGSVTVIDILPDPIGPFFRQPVPLLSPPVSWDILFIIGYDVLILIFLVFITGRLRASRTSLPGVASPAPAAPSYQSPQLQPVAGGAR